MKWVLALALILGSLAWGGRVSATPPVMPCHVHMASHGTGDDGQACPPDCPMHCAALVAPAPTGLVVRVFQLAAFASLAPRLDGRQPLPEHEPPRPLA